MTILDIDQDFFFFPVISGSLDNIKKINQIMVENFDNLIIKILPYIKDNTEFFCFDTHEKVGELILQKNLKNINLYHLDAHEDRDLKSNILNECNWISHIEDRCNNIFWIVNDKQKREENNLNLKEMNINDNIDIITWTKSSKWCPQKINLFEIFLHLLINNK